MSKRGPLTAIERGVLAEVQAGKSQAQIARDSGKSIHTIWATTYRIRHKLQIATTADLRALAQPGATVLESDPCHKNYSSRKP